MEARSSIFSFNTFHGPVKLTLALPVALAVVLAARFLAAPLRGVPDYEGFDFSRFVAAEKYEFRQPPGDPVVLLLGSSRTEYGFDKPTLAGALGVAQDQIRNLSVPDGNAWTSTTILRRNQDRLGSVRFMFFDAAPVQFNGDHTPLRNRFAHLASLGERLRVDGRPAFRAEQTLDFFSGHLGIRRTLKSYGMAVANGRRGVIWSPDDAQLLDPAWTRQDDEEIIRRDMFAENPEWRPENFATSTFLNFRTSQFIRDELVALESLAAAAGAHLIIHQPPFHPAFIDSIEHNPEWRQHYADYREFLLSRKSAHVTVLLWDRPEEIGISPDGLLDYGHFGRAAAEVYSKRLAAEIGAAKPAP